MKSLRFIAVFAILAPLFLTTSCTSDTKEFSETDILGKWVVKEAMRNGQNTNVLNGFYFDFQEGGKLSSNFNRKSEDQEYTFELKDGKIIRKGGEAIDIEFDMPTDSEMHLDTKLAGASFKLILNKASTDEEG